MRNKAKLQPTAALVMHWSKELYQQKPLDKYLDYLDLDDGEYLLKRCDDICDWYKEVILNRKMLIYNKAVLSILSNKEPSQIVIIAAGMCPLSLKILHNYDDKVSHIFEIDQSYMEEKSLIYNEFCPEHNDHVSCVSMDVTHPDLIKELECQENFDSEKPQIIIAEGISYYLSPSNLSKIIKLFSSPERKNRFIMDYLVPFNRVNIERRDIPREIFKIIQDHCQIQDITTYSQNDVENLFREIGRNINENFTLNSMEYMRKGKNRYFINPSDGWIQCALGDI